MAAAVGAPMHANACCSLPPTALCARSGFGEAAPELLGMYEVPRIFRHDLFASLGYRREDYRWAQGQRGCAGCAG